MKKISFLLLLFVTMVATAYAQVSFSVSQKRVSPTEIDLVFTGKADAGWHIYSTNIPEGGPNSAEFVVEAAEGARLEGALKPGAGVKTSYDPMFEMNISFFENKAVFTQRIRLTAENYRLKGYFSYSACNDQNCLPPTSLDAEVKGTDGPKAAAAATPKEQAEEALPAAAPEAAPADTAATNTAQAAPAAADSTLVSEWWTPVTDKLAALDGGANDVAGKSLLSIFLLGFLGGLVALLTPCVWPIIPMTVSFFLKRSGDKAKGVRDAVIYGISIVVIYVTLGLVITTVFGASALNDLSTNALFNVFFFLMLVVFAASFFGGFEITLPASWGNAVDSRASQTAGLLSIFLMAFTLSLVSFSCTGPIIGFLLVEVSTSGGSALAPTIGMLGFALALALPFTLFALFPTWLKKVPRGGGWMNQVKVTLGFLELAFALKFLSVADLAYGWHILDRETFLALWIVIFALLGIYLLGFLKFPHDDEGESRTSVPAFFIALCSLAFAVYMVPGLWGAPTKAVSAFAPPMQTQDFNLNQVNVEAKFKDYEEAMAYAQKAGKPVMVDFTGHGCVNCRKMELAVWHDPQVRDLLMKDYVLVSLYVDEKTPLPAKIVVTENGKEVTLRTVGDKWSYLQRTKFGANAQPFYVLLDNEGNPLTRSYSYKEDVADFVRFLREGIDAYAR
ncbi:MAG: protein-disulfide reductase DsbD family protein [Alloprevotella sp.]